MVNFPECAKYIFLFIIMAFTGDTSGKIDNLSHLDIILSVVRFAPSGSEYSEIIPIDIASKS